MHQEGAGSGQAGGRVRRQATGRCRISSSWRAVEHQIP